MKYIRKGSTAYDESNGREIIVLGRHFDDFVVETVEIDEDDNEIREDHIFTRSEISHYFNNSKRVIFIDDDEEESEEE